MKISRLSLPLQGLVVVLGLVSTAVGAEQTDPRRAEGLGSTGAIVRATLIGPPVSGEPAMTGPVSALGAESEIQRDSRERGTLQHWARLVQPHGRPAKAH